MEDKGLTFAPAAVGGRGTSFAKRARDVFWLLGDFLVNLNADVGMERRVPADLEPLFGHRKSNNQKKPCLTQDILGRAVQVDSIKTRGLHSFTSQLNLSTLYDRGCA